MALVLHVYRLPDDGKFIGVKAVFLKYFMALLDRPQAKPGLQP